MTADIDQLLRLEDVATLLETAESSGSVRQSELTELIEAQQLEALEIDALHRELEGRGIELIDDERRPSSSS